MSESKKKPKRNHEKLPGKTNFAQLHSHLEEWRKQVREVAEREVPPREASFATSSGITLDDVYIPSEENSSAEHYLTSLGLPGSYPFTRGIQPTMYRSRLWTMRQYAGFGTAREANARYRYLMAQGTTGLSIAFDLPTQMGRDSDDAFARGEVGRVGVAIDSLEDMETLFEGIPMEKVSTSMTINATAPILLALYLALAKKRGIPWTSLRGTIQNDILKEYIARGTYIYPPAPSLKLVTDTFEFCRDAVPAWNTISVSGYHIREAGSTAAQEVAFTLADGVAYVEAALNAGLEVDSFAPRMAFFFNCHNNFLEEVAKFRAARRIWAKIMRERFQAKNEKSWMLRFHTQTAGSTLTAQQPEVNIIRTTLQALAAVLGGTQSLHTNSYDEALCLPTAHAALLALRTQQVIGYESGVADVVDALGGSYVIEDLTNKLEERSLEYLARIDELGGMVQAIEKGFPQREIEDAAYRHQRDLELGHKRIVGTNIFTEVEGEAPSQGRAEVLKVDLRFEEEQIERLRERKAHRNPDTIARAIGELDGVVSAQRNVMPSLIDAVAVGVTLGEISNLFRRHYGEYHG